MPRWIALVLATVLLAVLPRTGRALPPPPPSERDAWVWEPVAVHYDVDPETVEGTEPFVPADTPSHAGAVTVEPGHAVVVWLSALATARVRTTKARSPGDIELWRVGSGPGEQGGRVREPGIMVGPGQWLLRQPVGWGSPWIITSTRRTELVVEQAVARRGERIWELVHQRALDWVDGRGSLPRVPDRPGSERYIRRRLADRALVEELELLPGYDDRVGEALMVWRRLRASAELEPMRPLRQLETIQPSDAPELGIPSNDPAAPDRGPHVRMTDRSWAFGVRGPAVLRLGARSRFSDDDDGPRPLTVVVTTRGEDGRDVVVGRLDALDVPLRRREDPSAPIPTLVDTRADDGSRVSVERELSIPLRPGKHDYRVEVRGDAVLRARLGRAHSRAHGRDSPRWRERRRTRALASLQDAESTAARVTRALLTDPWSDPAPLDPTTELTVSGTAPRVAAWLRLEALRRRPVEPSRVDELSGVAAALPAPAPSSPLDIELRLQLFEQWMAAGRPSRAVETLRPHAHQLNADELAALVQAVDDPAALWPIPGALDAVESRAPITSRLRRAHSRLWTWTEWEWTRPTASTRPWRWIEPPGSDPPPVNAPPGPLSSVPSGAAVTLVASPHPFEPDRTPVLRLLLHTPSPPVESVAIRVDDEIYRVAMPTGDEVFELALRPGRHEVQMDAPPHVLAFSNLPVAADDPARRRPAPIRTTMWPTNIDEEPVAFELGPLARDTLARVDVRVVDPAPGDGEPVEAWIRTDDGQRRLVRLRPPPRRTELIALPGTPSATERASVIVPVSRKATRLWVESEGTRSLAASVRIRRWLPPAASATLDARRRPGDEPATRRPRGRRGPSPAASAPELAAPDPYQRLADSTRRLAADPRSAWARIEHGHRLLDLDDVRRAREQVDLARELVAEDPSDPRVDALSRLGARLDAFIDDEFVVLRAAEPPVLLHPIDAGLAPDAEVAPVVADATEAARQGRLAQAFEGYARAFALTDAVELGHAAALVYADALRIAPEGPADPTLARLRPLAYGIVLRVRERMDTPRLRRLHAQVAIPTRWEPLRMAEHSAGTRDRGLPSADREPSEIERHHWALLAPPWAPTEGRLLRAGSQTVVIVEHPGPWALALEAFCDDSTADASAIELGLRTGAPEHPDAEQTVSVPARSIHRIQLDAPEGRLRLELSLPPDRPELRCSVRWQLEPPPQDSPEPQRPLRWFLAESGSPVEVIVLGPTTARISLQPESDPTPAVVEIADLHGSIHSTVSVPQLDPGTTELTLLVTRPGPQRIRVSAPKDPLLVRVAMRRDEQAAPEGGAESGDAPSPDDGAPPSAAALDGSAHPLWPAAGRTRPGQRVGDGASAAASRGGTLEAAVGFSRTDIAEADDFRPRNRLRGSLIWRRELWARHMWLKVAGHAQGRQGAGAAGGGAATLYAQRGPRAIRGFASATGWWERYAGRPAWSARATLHLDRPVGLSPSVAIIPFVRASYRHQLLDEGDVDLDAEPSHAQVYSAYVEDHPLAVTPGARARWYPYEDLQLSAEVSATPNADFGSIDHVDTELRAQGIVDTRVPLLIRYGGAYELSARLEDEDRSRSFLRHGPRANVGLTYVFGRIGRLNLDVRDTVYLSRPFATRNGFDVVLSFELTRGRGVRDTSPMEMLFRPMVRYRWWDEPTQERAR